MRLVLDTNVVASGLLWEGAPAQLLDAAQAGELELCTSRVLLAELARILLRAKFAKAIAASGSSLDELVLGYAELATFIEPASIAPTVLADPDNDHVLACALAARADLIVSGDRHLLDLARFHDMPIIKPAAGVKMLGRSPGNKRPTPRTSSAQRVFS